MAIKAQDPQTGDKEIPPIECSIAISKSLEEHKKWHQEQNNGEAESFNNYIINNFNNYECDYFEGDIYVNLFSSNEFTRGGGAYFIIDRSNFSVKEWGLNR